jgi:spore coat polysaccharide biosynthesis predicted glycosyltransferase SpsG
MLFSILIGATATLYFVVRAAIIKLKTLLRGGHATTTTHSLAPYVAYCEGRQYWNVFKPVLDEFNRRSIPLLYLTSTDDDPAFNANYHSITTEYIGDGNRAFARLNLLSADVVLMTTPGLDVYQLKRSKAVKHYAHILHATTDATMYRLFGLDYYDSVLLTGDYEARDIRTLEAQRELPAKQLVTVGCTYLDVYAERMKSLPVEAAHPFTVLVSPSWGPSALLAKYGARLLDPLAATNWRIIVRPHPQSKKSEAPTLDKIQKRYANNQNVKWDYERENIASLAKADVMISDFSGIIYDYTFLRDKPVIYVKESIDLRMYDAYDVDADPTRALWMMRALERIGIALSEDMFADIKSVIEQAADSPALRAAREKARKTAWMYEGEAGKRVVDFMLNTAEAAASNWN